ncbi:hypothetical protein Tco_0518244 [Tanacetum coccineum]
MSNLKFVDTHNLVLFLEKPEESDGFEGIIDFLNASSIRYALTVNPTIYTSCIKQFWATAKAKTVNGEVQIQALVDRKKVIVTETSVRKALQLKDAEEPFTNKAAKRALPIHSNDPLLSGEDILKLIELMELCTNLPQRVLDLENIKTSQASEITKLKERVKKLRVKGKKEENCDLDVKCKDTLWLMSSGEIDDNLMSYIQGVLMSRKLKNLIRSSKTKPKAFTTAATTTTTVVISPKARGVVVQDPNEEIAQRLQEELQAKLEEEERLARQKEEEDNLIS